MEPWRCTRPMSRTRLHSAPTGSTAGFNPKELSGWESHLAGLRASPFGDRYKSRFPGWKVIREERHPLSRRQQQHQRIGA